MIKEKSNILLVASFLLILCCNKLDKKDESTIKFRTLNYSDTGINFKNKLTYKTKVNIIEYLYYYNGGGVAIGDINNDGLEDIYFSGNQVSDRLYLNLGNLKFQDITLTSGIKTDSSWSNGVSFEDVNNDGYLDIYVCKVSPLSPKGTHNLLYINNKNMTFTESSSQLGLDFSGFSTHSTFLDYDKDGDLDMYLMNHAIHTVRSYGSSKKRRESDELSGDKFFENRLNEKDKKFVDVTKESNIYDSPLGYGLALTTTDFNNDGWLDLYVGNDFHENDYIYINNKDKTFTESIKKSMSHTSHFTMGVDVADLNQDGKLDVFTTDMMPYDPKIFLKSGGEDLDKISRIKKDLGFEQQFSRNHMQINRGNNTFSEVAIQTNTHATDWSWGVLLQDFDSDGKEDIFISNGILKRPNDLDYINYLSNVDFTEYNNSRQDVLKKKLIDKMPTLKIPNILFKNNGKLNFEKVNTSDTGVPSYSNGAAYADLDLDGDLDIVLNNLNSEATILENLTEKSNFISIKLAGNSKYPITKGARIELYVNGNKFVKENITTRGFQSSSSHNVFFGLGENKKIDSLFIRWPDGHKERKTITDTNQSVTISKGDYNFENELDIKIKKPTKFQVSYLPVKHEETEYYDYQKERLIPERLSFEGPAVVKADFNNDGFEDFFMGGAKFQRGKVFLSNKNKGFDEVKSLDLQKDNKYEDTDAAVFDIDNDGDLDLYVVSGGNEYKELDKNYMDRVYLNDGLGNFTRLKIFLPRTNGSSVSVSDFNNDGYDDLFVGTRSITGFYGLSPYSFFLLNNRDNTLSPVGQQRYGMVTDSKWVDINSDGKEDIVLVGDWMPITILIQEDDLKFVNKTLEYGLSGTNGLWNVVEIKDFNEDGKIDIIAGNAGTNFKWKPSITKPVKMYLDDFDGNQQPDPIIFYDFFGNYVPFSSKDKLDKQLPFLKKKFPNYNNFSKINDIKSLTGKGEKDILEIKYIYDLESSIFINEEKGFKKYALPQSAQLSNIEDFKFLKNSNDLIYVGNFSKYVTELGFSNANPGGFLFDLDATNMNFQNAKTLPLPSNKDYKAILDFDDNHLIFSNNDYIYSLSGDYLK